MLFVYVIFPCKLNEITPYMDGTLMYGHGKAVEDALRSFRDGLLKSTSRNIKDSFPEENNIRLPYANPPSPRDHQLRPVSRFRCEMLGQFQKEV